MPRPSLKEVRSEQILVAYAKCIYQFGFEGATQEKIAKEAGVKRSIIRHYLGNREDMIDALIDYAEKKFDEEVGELMQSLPDQKRIDALIDILFDPRYASDENSAVMLQALVLVSGKYPEIGSKIVDWSSTLIGSVQSELRQTYPEASEDQIFQVAFGVVALCFNIDSFSQISIPQEWWSASKDAAYSLVSTLN